MMNADEARSLTAQTLQRHEELAEVQRQSERQAREEKIARFLPAHQAAVAAWTRRLQARLEAAWPEFESEIRSRADVGFSEAHIHWPTPSDIDQDLTEKLDGKPDEKLYSRRTALYLEGIFGWHGFRISNISVRQDAVSWTVHW